MQVSEPEESGRLGATHFPWKKIRNPGAVGRTTFKSMVVCEPKTHFHFKNTRGVGTTGFFLGKHYRNPGAVGCITFKLFYSHAEPKTHCMWTTEGFSSGGGGGVF